MRLLNPPTDAFSRVRHGDLLDRAIERSARPKTVHAIVIICGKCGHEMHDAAEARVHHALHHGLMPSEVAA